MRPTRELEVIKADFKSRYRSGVVMLLYLIKQSRPEKLQISSENRQSAFMARTWWTIRKC
jgi:hypothetical protein